MFHSANGHLSAKEFSLLAREAGFNGATPIQRQLLPELHHEKDLLIEASREEGKELALLLPAISRSAPALKGTHSLVLTEDPDILGRSEAMFRAITSRRLKGQQISVLGREEQARKELKVISRQPTIIVGTPERIIDHLRRGNLDLSSLKTMVLDVPEEPGRESFEHDVEFIVSKCPGRLQSVVFTPEPDRLEFLKGFQKRPALLKREKREAFMPQIEYYPSAGNTAEETARVLIARGNMGKCLVVCGSPEEAAGVKQWLERCGIRSRPPGSKSGGPVIAPPMPEIPPVSGIGTILFAGTVPDPRRIRSIISEAGSTPENIALVLVGTQSEDQNTMTMEEKKLPSDEEVLKGHIQNILNIIKVDEDPELLNRYRALVRRNVPFFMRSYFAAYLLKENGGSLALSGGVKRGRSGRKEPSAGRKKEAPGQSSATQTLFVSIGKNRKVYPKDLVQLFRSTLSLEKEDVGAVKVLDNYSFVEINAEKSSQAIEKMDGMEFRGRKITVNFARKK